MFSKLCDLPITRSRPLIDDLVIIRDRKHILELIPRQYPNHHVLRWRRVLEFIDQPKWMRSTYAIADSGNGPHKATRFQYQTVEIHYVVFAKGVFVKMIQCSRSFSC